MLICEKMFYIVTKYRIIRMYNAEESVSQPYYGMLDDGLYIKY